MAGMRVAVLGAGNIGGTLGRKWIAAGRDVTFGVADPGGAKARALRDALGDRAVIKTAAEALTDADAVVFAIPGGAMDETIRANAAQLDGKLVIDAANRMGGGGRTDSRATFQQHAPRARYVRAFNTLGWENFADPTFDGVQADLFYAGPEADRAVVEQLIGDVGLRPIRVGDSDQAGLVDSVLPLWIALASRQGMGRHLAFKVLTR
jgi:predicted dinucleotide-binding enzyme